MTSSINIYYLCLMDISFTFYIIFVMTFLLNDSEDREDSEYRYDQKTRAMQSKKFLSRRIE